MRIIYKFTRKLFKPVLIIFLVILMLLTNVPVGAYVVFLQAYKDGNVVDVMWQAMRDGSVVDNFGPSEAQAVTPITFVDDGTPASGTGAVTPGLPTGVQANDILLLHIEGEGEDANADPAPTGGAWTLVDTVASATNGSADRTRQTVYWHRYTGSAPNLTVPDAGNHTLAVITAWRGATTTGSPIHNYQSSSSSTNNNSVSATGVTTSIADTMIVISTTAGDNITYSNWSNGSLANPSIAEAADVNTASGSQGSIGVAYGGRTSTGSSGTTTATVSATEEEANFTIALIPAASTYSVSGTFHGTSESGGDPGQCDGSTANLSLRVNGGTAVTTSCTDSTGAFTFSGVSASAGDTITIYSTGADKANTVYVSDGTEDTGILLYEDHLTVRDEQDGTVTNADLGDYDNDDNATDMLFTSNSNNLSVESGVELHVHTGDTLDPGGTITTSGSGNVHVDDSATIHFDTATNTIGGDVLVDDGASAQFDTNTTVSGGDITVSGGGDVSSSGGSVTMGASGTIGGGSAGSVFQLTNLTVSSGTTTLGSDADDELDFTGDISVSAGATLEMNNKTADVDGGNVTTSSSGSITCNSCTSGGLTLSGNGSTNGLGGGTGSITLNSLTLDGSTNTTTIGSSTSSVTILNDLTIGSGRTLTAASGGTINIAGDWTNSGTFSPNSGTVNFNGVGGTTQSVAGETSFYNLSATTSVTRTLAFEDGATQFVFNGLELTGASCNAMLLIRSTNPGTRFIFDGDYSGTENLDYLDIQDFDDSTSALAAENSVDSGNNSNIIINGNSCEGGSTSELASQYSFQRKTFKDEENSIHWLAFHDGDEIEFKASTDNGATWSRETELDYDTNDFSLFDKTISTTAYVVVAVASGNDILVRRGDLTSTPSVAWQSAVTALNGSGASDTYDRPYVTLDSSNNIWVGARHFDGTNYVFKVVKSDAALDSTWGSMTFGTETQISDTQTDPNVYGNIVPLASDDMYAVFATGAALEGCVWDNSDSDWETSDGSESCVATPGGPGGNGTEVNIDNTSDFGSLLSHGRQIVRTSGGDLYTFLNDGGNCEVWSSTNNGSSWSIQDSADDPACATTGNTLALAIDSTDTLHLVYRDSDAASADLLHRTFTTSDNQFGSVSTIRDISTSGFAVSAIAVDSNDNVHVAFISGNGSGTSIFYDNNVGGSFGTDIEIEVATFISGDPDIIVDEEDLPIVAFTDESGNLSAAVGDQNDASSFTVHDVDPSVIASTASVGVDAEGNVWISYVRDDTVDDVTLATRADGNETSSWSTGWTADITNNNFGVNTSIVVNGTDIYVFYEDDANDIVFDHYNGSTWSGETALATGTYQDVKAKWSFVNNNNPNDIDYIYSDGTDVYFNSYALSGGAISGTQDSIDTIPTGSSKTLSAVSDPTNNDVHLLFVDDEATDQISYRRWDNDGASSAWQSAVNIDSGNDNAYPSLSIDLDSNDLYAFYIDTSTGTIHYEKCTFDESICETADWGDDGGSGDNWHTGTNSYVTSSYGETSETFAMWIVGSGIVTVDWDDISGGSVTVTFTQNSYRWYVDNDGTNPTDPWSANSGINLAENTAITMIPSMYDPPDKTQELRLRVNYTVNQGNLVASSKYFKLQYKAGTDGSCTTGSWADVAGGSAWDFATSSVTNGTAVTGVLTDTDVDGLYVKTKPSAINSETASEGQQVEYDFHIIGSSSQSATQYSFRVVETDSAGTETTLFDSYTNCPTLTTEPEADNFMRHGMVKTEASNSDGFFWTD